MRRSSNLKNMWSFPKIFLILVLTKNCYAAPAAPSERVETDPRLIAGYTEGDMILSKDRNGLINEALRWPNGIVYYRFNSDIDQRYRNMILQAFRTIESISCVVFQEANCNQLCYLNIISDGFGCFADVGYQHSVQRLNLMKFNCYTPGIILHELLHSLGFYHQHTTWNRDEYVRINEENIKESEIHNFIKNGKDKVTNFGEGYDYGSIMHYQFDALSKNGKPTIEPLIAGYEKLIGTRQELSMADIRKLNAMYKCHEKV
ncbi:PREDICTED: low choriolytic enzyme-like [Drosophila arizonae]|uniref:Metalloendopeptidase n=1 Tax=Drosophila arizonae TaxID=7263 RepID=A0ABM1NZV1_DROAR|nr:PREDICTED: low choriolytic enzyme-like [Drosophila arizonae]